MCLALYTLTHCFRDCKFRIFLESLLLMNSVTVSWFIIVIIMIIGSLVHWQKPPICGLKRRHFKGSLLLSVSKLIDCYLHWMIYKGCWKFRISVWEAHLGGVVFDQAASEGVMYRETPLLRNISASASKPIWHPNLIVRKKKTRNFAATEICYCWQVLSSQCQKDEKEKSEILHLLTLIKLIFLIKEMWSQNSWCFFF